MDVQTQTSSYELNSILLAKPEQSLLGQQERSTEA